MSSNQTEWSESYLFYVSPCSFFCPLPSPGHLFLFTQSLTLCFPFRSPIPPLVAPPARSFPMAFLLLRWQLRFPPFPIAFIIVPFVFYYICMCVQPLRRALRVVLSLVFSFPVLFFFLTRLPSLWTFSSRTTSHHGWKRIFHFQFSCFCVLSARSSDRTLELNSRIPRPTAPPECGANIRPNREMNNSIRSRGLWLDFRRVRNVFEKCNHRTIRSQDGWLGGEKCVWNLQLRISTFKIREKTSNPKQFCIELAIYLWGSALVHSAFFWFHSKNDSSYPPSPSTQILHLKTSPSRWFRELCETNFAITHQFSFK